MRVRPTLVVGLHPKKKIRAVKKINSSFWGRKMTTTVESFDLEKVDWNRSFKIKCEKRQKYFSAVHFDGNTKK